MKKIIHKTWFLLFVLSILGVVYLGYVNLWHPVEMLIDAEKATGKSVNFFRDLFNFIVQKDMLELIKVVTPIIIPIITYKVKNRMDADIKQVAATTRHTTNKVVRDKLGIADRRKTKVKTEKNKRRG